MGKKRLRKQFEVPKKIWDKERIEKEKKIKEEYGLRNSRELWKAQTELRKIRREARELLSGKGSDLSERSAQLLGRVKKLFIRKKDASLDDILSLSVYSVLERRLQTIVLRKGFASSPKQARQLIVHGHVFIGDKKVSSPGYLVSFDEENDIFVKSFNKQEPKKKEERVEKRND